MIERTYSGIRHLEMRGLQVYDFVLEKWKGYCLCRLMIFARDLIEIAIDRRFFLQLKWTEGDISRGKMG